MVMHGDHGLTAHDIYLARYKQIVTQGNTFLMVCGLGDRLSRIKHLLTCGSLLSDICYFGFKTYRNSYERWKHATNGKEFTETEDQELEYRKTHTFPQTCYCSALVPPSTAAPRHLSAPDIFLKSSIFSHYQLGRFYDVLPQFCKWNHVCSPFITRRRCAKPMR